MGMVLKLRSPYYEAGTKTINELKVLDKFGTPVKRAWGLLLFIFFVDVDVERLVIEWVGAGFPTGHSRWVNE
jgi:hypothetical protein